MFAPDEGSGFEALEKTADTNFRRCSRRVAVRANEATNESKAPDVKCNSLGASDSG